LTSAGGRKKFSESNKNLFLLFVNDGSTDSTAEILKNNLNDTVFLLGYVSREELLSYYKNCLAVIYLPYDEPFGLPYLEAAYFSKPSIASNHGGPAELVINGKTGLLVSPSDINEISNAIKTISKDKDAAEIMGNNANKFLKEKFLWEMYINRFLTQIQ